MADQFDTASEIEALHRAAAIAAARTQPAYPWIFERLGFGDVV